MMVSSKPTIESAPSCICGGVPTWQRTGKLEQCPCCNTLKAEFALKCPGCERTYGQCFAPLPAQVQA